MDGARISNAAVSLGLELGEITGRLGVDILSLGGTKNGLMFGDAIVVWRAELAENLKYIRKQGMQLASKMRYISTQFATLFGTDLWRENALHANELAQVLAAGLRDIPGIEIVHPVEANGVFARFPRAAISRIQEEIFFYMWDPEADIVRLMLSFDSTMEDVTALLAVVRKHLS
jgi:threonine aldolase